ncbi:MAG: cryptochrome/photolyase family protein [Burkholderiales bacterium]|nr:MAG: cryptochrome/photolyase family protein [Burkholderiales bacterium]
MAETKLRLILGDQLNPGHSWFSERRDDIVYVMMEMRQETDYVLHHAQKILAIFAAMRAFAQRLKEAGHRVRYVKIGEPSNRQDLCANLEALARHYGASTFAYQEPDEWRLDAQLQRWCEGPAKAMGLHCSMVSSAHFLTTRSEVQALFQGRAQWLMEHFYRHMRRRHGVLLDARQQPEGGRWNFDADNRKPWVGQPPEPPDWRRPHDHSALWSEIEDAGVRSFGQPCADALPWPLDREEALSHLDAFVARSLPHFGDYQDALSSRASRLFHSLLSFALNTKMLSPLEVIQRVEGAWQAGQVSLSSAEGFIRQILGWREYVRGVYWARMPGYVEGNALGHQAPLPPWFWSGHTRMACVASAIGQSLSQAHAHHIQRLMVIGNLALLAGLSPQALHQWYLGVYIDAFEWVEAPNTLGMSQYADGGLLATKPYVSSAAYLQRMGDHCRHCCYQPKERLGERACPFNALYWDFHLRHEPSLRGNHRLQMVYRQLDRMAPTEQQAIKEKAAQIRRDLDSL